MPTIKQRRVAKGLIDNLAAKKPSTQKEIIEAAGYSPKTASNAATQIMQNEGVKESLISFGFNEERAKEVVAEILVAGENDTVKLKAAEMIFKVHGTFAAEKHVNLNITTEPSDKIKELAEKLRRAQ